MSGDHKGYYAALEVSVTASPEEIKKAYRRLALQFHPDKNPAEDAKHKFQLISHAYAVLSDEAGRAGYDRGEDEDGDDAFDMPDDEFFFQVFQSAFAGMGGMGGGGRARRAGGGRGAAEMDFIAAAMHAAMFGGFGGADGFFDEDEEEEDLEDFIELLPDGRLGCGLCSFKTRSEEAIFNHITEKHAFFPGGFAPEPRRAPKAKGKRGKRVRVGGRRI